jgi:hypothetical protein
MWWMKQSDEARKDFTDRENVDIAKALCDFRDFYSTNYQVWGNSARFDLGILQNAYNKLYMPIPWDFRKERCVRILVSFRPEIKANYKLEGIAHNALHGCYYQVGYCSEIWKEINRNKIDLFAMSQDMELGLDKAIDKVDFNKTAQDFKKDLEERNNGKTNI